MLSIPETGEDFGWTIGVYGTLREGGYNHPIMEELIKNNHAEPLGIECIRGWIIMDIGGGLPGAYPCSDEFDMPRLQLELYHLTDTGKAVLDRLEGHPKWYRRELLFLPSDERAEETYDVGVYRGPLPKTETEIKGAKVYLKDGNSDYIEGTTETYDVRISGGILYKNLTE